MNIFQNMENNFPNWFNIYCLCSQNNHSTEIRKIVPSYEIKLQLFGQMDWKKKQKYFVFVLHSTVNDSPTPMYKL